MSDTTDLTLNSNVECLIFIDTFRIAWFHPWKYQSTPEIWASLYRDLFQSFMEMPSSNRLIPLSLVQLWRKICLNHQRIGNFPIVSFLIFLSVSSLFVFTSFFVKAGFLSKMIWTLGIGNSILLIRLIFLYFKTRDRASGLLREYLRTYDVNGQLGTQGEIQDELKNLLKVWVPDPGRTPRVLLISDDWDRCPPEWLLPGLDALRALLEDNDIHRRIVVLAAMDEKILFRAIIKKYSHLDADTNQEKLAREYLDKLFLFGVRLPDLNKVEQIEIMGNIIAATMPEPVAAKTSAARAASSLMTRFTEAAHTSDTAVKTALKAAEKLPLPESKAVDHPFEPTTREPLPFDEMGYRRFLEPISDIPKLPTWSEELQDSKDDLERINRAGPEVETAKNKALEIIRDTEQKLISWHETRRKLQMQALPALKVLDSLVHSSLRTREAEQVAKTFVSALRSLSETWEAQEKVESHCQDLVVNARRHCLDVLDLQATVFQKTHPPVDLLEQQCLLTLAENLPNGTPRQLRILFFRYLFAKRLAYRVEKVVRPDEENFRILSALLMFRMTPEENGELLARVEHWANGVETIPSDWNPAAEISARTGLTISHCDRETMMGLLRLAQMASPY